jgi:plasmid stabilization system protein ParE
MRKYSSILAELNEFFCGMITKSLSILSIDPSLEENAVFYQLKALSDADEEADLLATKGTDVAQKRWLRIAKTTEDLAQSHADGRLDLLSYRAELRLHGVYAALGRLISARAGIQVMLESMESTAKISDGSAQCEVAYYFFSDLHLREFTSAILDESVGYTPNDILQCLHSKSVTTKGNHKHGHLQKKMQEVLSSWGANHHDILHRLHSARDFFHDLERWLSKYNTFDIAVNTTSIQCWLSRLEDLLLPYINPSKNTKELAALKNSAPGAATIEAATCHTDGHYQDANTYHSNPGMINTNTGSVNAISIGQLTREDVIRSLGSLCQWYALNEPGSPAPFFLQRAIRTMNSDFMTILQDLLPESVGAFEKMVGLGTKK